MNKFEIQDHQYEFPYHYIPQYLNETFSRSRELSWGGEYLAYLKFICEKIIKNHAKTVLDVGCGDGRLCNILNSYNTFEKIKGVDLSERAIDWAKLFNPSLEFEVKDVTMEQSKWDAIVVVEVIEYIPDDKIDVFFRSIYQVLKNDGKIYLTVPSKNIPLNKKHYRHYDIEMIKEHIRNSGVNLKIEESGYIVPEKNKVDEVVRKLFYNRFWKFAFYDTFEWKRLWKNGLITSNKRGRHCYAILSKSDC